MDGRKYLKVKLQHRAEWEKPSALIPAAVCGGSRRGGCSKGIRHLAVPWMYAVTEEFIPSRNPEMQQWLHPSWLQTLQNVTPGSAGCGARTGGSARGRACAEVLILP